MDVISLRMKDFQDTYEVTDNLGQFSLTFSSVCTSAIMSEGDGHVLKWLNVWTGSLEVEDTNLKKELESMKQIVLKCNQPSN